MILLVGTLVISLGTGFVLFRVYSILLHLFLNKMNWDLKELKTYNVTPGVKVFDKVLELGIIAVIIWKVFYT